MIRWHKVLNSEIPAEGFGRPLTSTESRAVGVPRGSIVLRCFDSEYRGQIYRRAKGGGFDSTGLYVETK